jgi:hypothetical protein
MEPIRAMLAASATAAALASLSLSCRSPTHDAPLAAGEATAFGGGGGGGDVVGIGEEGGAPSTPSTCAFATTPTPYALPPLAGAPVKPFAAVTGSIACSAQGSTKLTYELVDMNADGLLDLVVTSSCDDATVGTNVWLVYLASATGFATTAMRYALPPPVPSSCATKTTLVDVDGDLRPDWVVTSTCSDAYVGTSRWLVYPNGAAGFAQTATTYALPPGASLGAFATMNRDTVDCANAPAAPAFAFFDITGDAKPDIVTVKTCSDSTIGTTVWGVYAGSATGVAQTAAHFALPTTPTFTPGAFARVGGPVSCTSGSLPAFGLFDFNADGKLDIVVTSACSDPTVGETHWLFYANAGSGFAAAPTSIALPALAGAAIPAFPALGASGSCAEGMTQPAYTLVDGNGDGRLDLLVTRDCADVQTGAVYWQLFVAGASGFASSAQRLILPPALGAQESAPIGLSANASCSAPVRPTFDAIVFPTTLAAVVTADCNDATVGQSRWMLYPASCASP